MRIFAARAWTFLQRFVFVLLKKSRETFTQVSLFPWCTFTQYYILKTAGVNMWGSNEDAVRSDPDPNASATKEGLLGEALFGQLYS
mmetsp:Transcript_27853/g.81758  ORF Transcript_27853/g.81758 Transcript_27853/m.81758 type:complete len:86 (+) Transcript_27853:450-707(+)